MSKQLNNFTTRLLTIMLVITFLIAVSALVRWFVRAPTKDGAQASAERVYSSTVTPRQNAKWSRMFSASGLGSA